MTSGKLGSLQPLAPEALADSLAATVACAPTGEIWIFAYGSLLWSPCFTPAETLPGVLTGYRRAFNIWTIHTRGTRDAPGLGLGLEPGGRCPGVLLRVAEETRQADIGAIWQREMFTGIYRPCWLPVESDAGERQAICFVTDAAHPQYAGALPPEEAARIIARAEGVSGRCSAYLFDLLKALETHSIDEPELDALAALVRANAPR